jgi:2-keto-4-pentenoate hydratase/2-oxohepta-3-ene-1,7-dioic acid hydratase in catechol pathway
LEALASGLAADAYSRDVEWLPPLQRPGKILCVGVNYPERNAEYNDGSDVPKYPSLFVRFPSSFVGHDTPILRPPESAQFDYEGEIVLVIGKAGRRIPQERAHEHIFGLTLMNEGSVRDWLRHGKFNVTQGKNFDRSGSIGPWIVTREACGNLADLELVTRVNGEPRQRGNTGTLMFPFARIVNYISTFTTLSPGDLIATGTPPGAGARFDPPRWLKSGDVVEIACPAIGTLRNTVADEAA